MSEGTRYARPFWHTYHRESQQSPTTPRIRISSKGIRETLDLRRAGRANHIMHAVALLGTQPIYLVCSNVLMNVSKLNCW